MMMAVVNRNILAVILYMYCIEFVGVVGSNNAVGGAAGSGASSTATATTTKRTINTKTTQNHPFMEIRPIKVERKPKIFLYIRSLEPLTSSTTSVYKATLGQDRHNRYVMKFKGKSHLKKELLTHLSVSCSSPYVPPIMPSLAESTSYTEWTGIPFLVMMHIPNTDHKRQFEMTDDELIKYSFYLAEALESYQHAGFIHCNLNPWNVVIDWGSSKLWIVDWASAIAGHHCDSGGGGDSDDDFFGGFSSSRGGKQLKQQPSDFAPPELTFTKEAPSYNTDIWSAAIIILSWLFQDAEITKEKVVLNDGSTTIPLILLQVYGSAAFYPWIDGQLDGGEIVAQGWSKTINLHCYRHKSGGRHPDIYNIFLPIIDDMLKPSPQERINCVQLVKRALPARLVYDKVVHDASKQAKHSPVRHLFPERFIEKIKITNDEFSILSWFISLL